MGYGIDAGTDHWRVNWLVSLPWVTGETAGVTNAVRVFEVIEAFGVQTAHSHLEFLEQAQEVGLFVIPGFATNVVCDDFDGYQS